MGSARVSRVGDGVPASADFSKACFGETPRPMRETRALPREKSHFVDLGEVSLLAYLIRLGQP